MIRERCVKSIDAEKRSYVAGGENGKIYPETGGEGEYPSNNPSCKIGNEEEP